MNKLQLIIIYCTELFRILSFHHILESIVFIIFIPSKATPIAPS